MGDEIGVVTVHFSALLLDSAGTMPNPGTFWRHAKPLHTSMHRSSLAAMTRIDSVLNLPDDTRMLDVVRAGLDRTDDVRIAVSFTRCSGLGLLIDPLRGVIDRGGKV